MIIPRPVEADRDPRELPDGRDLPRHQYAIRVHTDGDVPIDEPIDDLVDVSVRQWVPSIEVRIAHPEIVELSERLEDAVTRQLPWKRSVPVAVGAFEVAPPRHLVAEREWIGADAGPSDRSPEDHRGMHGVGSLRRGGDWCATDSSWRIAPVKGRDSERGVLAAHHAVREEADERAR